MHQKTIAARGASHFGWQKTSFSLSNCLANSAMLLRSTTATDYDLDSELSELWQPLPPPFGVSSPQSEWPRQCLSSLSQSIWTLGLLSSLLLCQFSSLSSSLQTVSNSLTLTLLSPYFSRRLLFKQILPILESPSTFDGGSKRTRTNCLALSVCARPSTLQMNLHERVKERERPFI